VLCDAVNVRWNTVTLLCTTVTDCAV
jgi:hypothetical protein